MSESVITALLIPLKKISLPFFVVKSCVTYWCMLDCRLGDLLLWNVLTKIYTPVYFPPLLGYETGSCLFYRWWWWVQRGLWHGQHEQWRHVWVWADRCHRTHGHGRRRTLLQLHTRQAQQVRVRTGQVVCDLLGNTDCHNIQSLFKKCIIFILK